MMIFLTGIVILQSCTEDLLQGSGLRTEGEQISILLNVTMPEMTVQTRANIGDEELYKVNNVWIAIFNAESGEMTSFDNDGNRGWIKIESQDGIPAHTLRNVTVKTLTGMSRIVAVANVDNQGILADGSGGTLRDLLDKVRTWDGFLKVGVRNYTTANHSDILDETDRPETGNGIPMSGVYIEEDTHTEEPSQWIEKNDASFDIQESTDFSKGAIHLRRTLSHITFNLRYEGGVIDFEPISFTLRNVPRYSNFYEAGMTNFGDAVDSEEKTAQYYVDCTYPARLYVDNLEATGTEKPGFTFDFWMAENKHDGIISPSGNDTEQIKYNKREERFPDNHSYFKSLLRAAEFDSNNLASFVEIQAIVTYKEKKTVDDNGNESTGTDAVEVTRTGNVTYTVHLGYIDKEENDFRSYRNCNYTYNMRISGVDEVRLEATADEVRNGIEGTVTDIESQAIILDSHFQQFNVRFTETELSFSNTPGENGTQSGFGFTLTTFDNYEAHTFTEQSRIDQTQHKYSDWIEIKSTDGPETMARYIPYTKPFNMNDGEFSTLQNNNGGSVMPIREFYRKIKEIHDNGGKLSDTFTQNSDGYFYFTIFVKEYAYESGPEAEDWGREYNKTSSWNTYVNQPNRRCNLRVRRRVSGDGESIYARSLYYIEQRSIQTFYNNYIGSGDISQTAFGVEHVNETEGMNLRSNAPWGNGNTLSDVNGRYNTSLWIKYKDSSTSPSWSNFVSLTSELVIPNAKTINRQNGPRIFSEENGWNPASGNSDKVGYAHVLTPVNYSGTLNAYAYDPQASSRNSSYYIEAVNACMNRNRDENGDGRIDNEEVKWYVPASGKYMRAILGRHSLESPIMPYTKVTELPNINNRFNTRYLLYSSDNKVIWAMEGLSMSDYVVTGNDNYKNVPWQVRCIRNLGTDLTDIQNIEKITRAYQHTDYASVTDGAEGKFTMTYYDPNSVRDIKFTGKGNGEVTTAFNSLQIGTLYDDEVKLTNDGRTFNYMPIHSVTSNLNMVYKAFEYGSMGSYIPIPSNQLITYIWNPDKNPCYQKSGPGWRLPNQKELAIMRNQGLFENMPEKDNSNYFNFIMSCTYTFFDRKNNGTNHVHNGFTFEYDNKDVLQPSHKLIVSRKDGGTLSQETTTTYRFYYRCVRDVEP